LKNVFFVRAKIDFIDKLFAQKEVKEIWLTFPDPQPTKRREKKRLTSPRFLDMYKMILTKDNFVNLKTDSTLLYEYTLEVLKERGERIYIKTSDVYKDFPDDNVLGIKTFYEQMFLEEGKSIKYIKFRILKD